MKILSVNSYEQKLNSNISRPYTISYSGRVLDSTRETKQKEFKVNRLRAIVTCMIATGSAVIASVLWFYFTKGKVNINK